MMLPTACRAALLGAATGVRSMVGLAAVAFTTPAGVRPGWVGWLGSRWGRGLVVAAAAGEVIADKSPRLPSRMAPPVLAQRVVVAGLGAAALARRRGVGVSLPVLLAVAAAVGATAAGTRWRGYAQQRGKGLGAAAVEDLVAVGLATGACGRRSPAALDPAELSPVSSYGKRGKQPASFSLMEVGR